jgi:DNA-binding NtrC family response regulator
MMRQQPYQLVLADINMPGNCSLEMLDAADEIAPDVPFILITASGSRETAISAVGTQVSAYLEKPVAVDRLRKAIEKALSEKQESTSQHTQLMKEVVTVLTETRQNFKSRRLGELRKKVQTALGDSISIERGSSQQRPEPQQQAQQSRYLSF